MSSVSGCHISWNISVENVESRTASLIEKARSMYDAVAATSDVSWESTAQKLSLFEADYFTEKNALDFPQYVFPCKEIRDASVNATRKISDVEVELEWAVLTRYSEMKTVISGFTILGRVGFLGYKPPYSQSGRKCQKKIEAKRVQRCLHLDEEGRKKIEALSKEENRLCIDFTYALNEECTVMEFTKDELAGCPHDFISGLKCAPSGKLQLSLKYPHYFPASEKAENPETRKALECAFNSRCIKENRPILKRLMEVRKERSSLLDFPTHADFMLDTRMAKTAQNVASFLQEVAQKLELLRSKECARLLELKREECDRLGLPLVNKLEPWDFRYYMNLAKERDHSVDHQKLKKYFPLDAVKAGVLRLYQHLLGLTFARVETTDIWHPEVEMYSVTDTTTEILLGYFYLDLHPRDGKYSHAAVFELQPGCVRSSATASGEGTERQVTMAAMVVNFTGPTAEQPVAYLLHDEVETFFHEFGHLMHQLCARADMAIFSGTRVETDFVECPSQMLENWVWTEDGLKALLGDAFSSMPRDLLDSLLASRTAGAGLFYARQLLLASFDQAIHTSRWNDDPQEVYVELSRKMIGIDPSPCTCMPASFAHLAGGYDARYYGYMWSLVFSADLYETRFRHAPDGGCLSKSVGLEYRRKILQPGGTKDAVDMLRDFLGREPESKAFFKLLGIEA
ncbi:Thimet oligopeptidase [Paragonimus heterotremus]|uniref:Thimet oligopeptidase n=1 Tax=Paragonimus heterotremus TaxID=100268 RepID=A0A8J4T6A6_9TREM|nr:Thimet oligopeptidase [Paragonimus heterotremus]